MSAPSAIRPEHARIEGGLAELFLSADLVSAALGQQAGYAAEARQRFARRFRGSMGKLPPGASPIQQDDAGLRSLFDDLLGWKSRLADAGDEDVGEAGIIRAGLALVDPEAPTDGGLTAPHLALVCRAPWRADLDRKHPDARFNVSWTDAFERVLARRNLPWGIITSGNVLRVVRRGTASRAAYLEIDLESLADDLDAADAAVRRSAVAAFDLLVLLAQASAFDPKERGKHGRVSDHVLLAVVAEDEERQVGTDLSQQVYPALEWILRGVLEHPANRGDRDGPTQAALLLPGSAPVGALAPGGLDLRSKGDPSRFDEDALRELDRQGLILLYRLLFLFMADARELTPRHVVYQRGYAARAVAREAIRGWDALPDVERAASEMEVRSWRALQATFRIARNGLTLPDGTVFAALGGSLFDPLSAPLLEIVEVGERHLVEAFRRLTRRQVRVTGERGKWLPIEFARLDIERMGSVYEGLLDFEPRVAAEAMVEIGLGGGATAVVAATEASKVLADLDALVVAKARHAASKEDDGDEEDDEEADAEEEDNEGEENVDEPNHTADLIGAGEGPPREEGEAVEGVGEAIRTHRRFVRAVPKGRFYLAGTGARRKGSGSYYTPVAFTNFTSRELIRRLAQGRGTAEILKLRLVDPAAGSGAFLVAACRILGEAYTEAAVAEGKVAADAVTPQRRAEHRRLVAEHCLYGVDLNPMAVELAKLSLWLETLAEGRPLTFLDHRIRCGNSLIGARLRDLDTLPEAAFAIKLKNHTKAQSKALADLRRRNGKDLDEIAAGQLGLAGTGADVKAPLAHVRTALAELEGPDDTLAQVEAKARAFRKLTGEDADYRRLRETLDLWCAAWFWPAEQMASRPATATYRGLVQAIWKGEAAATSQEKAALAIAREVARRRRFFHWELEFPEIGSGGWNESQVAGFDAVAGNPPWDKIKAQPLDFFPSYDPLFRSYKRARTKAERERLLQDPNVARGWRLLQDEADLMSGWTRTAPGYLNQIGGREPNVYRAFAERGLRLLRKGGLLGFILPSNFCSEDSGKGIRRLWLLESRWHMARVFENKGIFPIHNSLKFGVFVVEAGSATEALDAAFMLHRPEQLENPGEARLSLTIPSIKSFSGDSLALLELRRGEDVDLAARIWAKAPTLGDHGETTAWHLTFGGDVHLTNNAKLLNTARRGYVCLENKMFWQYDLRLDHPNLWAEPEMVRPLLLRREEKRYKKAAKALLGHPADPAAGGALLLHVDGFRIAYRDIARNEDARTLICAIVPPGWLTSDAGPGTFAFQYAKGDGELAQEPSLKPREWFFAVGALNSLVSDYAIRLIATGTDIKIHHLEKTPIPRLRGGSAFEAVAERAAQLTCVEESFAQLWKTAFGKRWLVSNGCTDEVQRAHLKAEIDAIIARWYGLSADDLQYLLSTFRALGNTDAAKYGEYRTRTLVLDAFARLQDDYTFTPQRT